MAVMTPDAEAELGSLAGEVREAIIRLKRTPTCDGRYLGVVENYNVKLTQLGHRAAILLPVLLEELRDLRARVGYTDAQGNTRSLLGA